MNQVNYTIDGGQLAPHPGMTDEELADFERDFGIDQGGEGRLQSRRPISISFLICCFVICPPAWVAAIWLVKLLIRFFHWLG
jgi:hypothetical protein